MKKFISKYAFWVLQILGCLALTVIASFAISPSGGIGEKVLFFTAIFLSLFIPTTVLRYLYKWFINEYPFRVFDFVKIVFFLALAVVLGKELPYYLGYLSARVADIFGLFRELKIDIKTPKNTGLFRYVGPLILFVGWTIFYFTLKEFRKYIASNVARSALKDKIKQAQLNTLKGHLNPQFMVASLQIIRELMLTDVALARNLLTKLSEILRYSLTKNNINSVSLQEDLEIAENFVDLLNIVDKDKYEVMYDIDSGTHTYEVPPMLLMSLMEIAVKNGILQLNGGGKAVLTSEKSESGLEIRLTHTGKISRSKATEVLENTIKQRLRLLFEGKADYRSVHELNTTTLFVNMPFATI